MIAPHTTWFGPAIRAATVLALLACLLTLPSSATAGVLPVAHSAKKCKKHGRSAVTAKKKCKRAGRVTPPTQPVMAPPAPTPASLSISPTSHPFGTVPPGDSANQTFTVTNSGGSPSGTLASSLSGTNPASYVISSDTCNGIAVGGGSTCTLDVHCHTTDITGATLTATLTVVGSPGGSPSATLTCFETT